MDWSPRVFSIHRTLRDNGFADISASIVDAQSSAGTPREAFAIVCSKLLGLKKSNHKVYKMIEEDADSILAYAKSIHYQIIPT